MLSVLIHENVLDCLIAGVEASPFQVLLFFFIFLSGSILKAVGLNLSLLKFFRHLTVLLCDNLKKCI